MFGVGSALVIDEFCLILFVEDTYWQERGVNASVAAYGVFAAASIGNLYYGRVLYERARQHAGPAQHHVRG